MSGSKAVHREETGRRSRPRRRDMRSRSPPSSRSGLPARSLENCIVQQRGALCLGRASATVTIGSLQGARKDKTSNLFERHLHAHHHQLSHFQDRARRLQLQRLGADRQVRREEARQSEPQQLDLHPAGGLHRDLAGGGRSTLDAVSGVQFYTPTTPPTPQCPALHPRRMGNEEVSGRLGLGLIVGTVQQLGDDRGDRRCAERLSRPRLGDRPDPHLRHQVRDKAPLSFSLRWVPTVESQEPPEEHEHRHGDGNAYLLKGST